ncbi:hypothetical protein, partial [Lactococcus petauri]
IQSIDPEIGKQKVASTANPMALKETTKLSFDLASPGTFKANLQNFNNQDMLSQNVPLMSQLIHTHDGFSGADYTYQLFKNNNTDKQFMVATRTGEKKTVDYNSTSVLFKKSVDKLIDYHFKVVGSLLSTAFIAVAMALAYSNPVSGSLASALSLAFGGIMDGASLNIFAENIVLYHKTSDETTKLFNVL